MMKGKILQNRKSILTVVLSIVTLLCGVFGALFYNGNVAVAAETPTATTVKFDTESTFIGSKELASAEATSVTFKFTVESYLNSNGRQMFAGVATAFDAAGTASLQRDIIDCYLYEGERIYQQGADLSFRALSADANWVVGYTYTVTFDLVNKSYKIELSDASGSAVSVVDSVFYASNEGDELLSYPYENSNEAYFTNAKYYGMQITMGGAGSGDYSGVVSATCYDSTGKDLGVLKNGMEVAPEAPKELQATELAARISGETQFITKKTVSEEATGVTFKYEIKEAASTVESDQSYYGFAGAINVTTDGSKNQFYVNDAVADFGHTNYAPNPGCEIGVFKAGYVHVITFDFVNNKYTVSVYDADGNAVTDTWCDNHPLPFTNTRDFTDIGTVTEQYFGVNMFNRFDNGHELGLKISAQAWDSTGKDLGVTVTQSYYKVESYLEGDDGEYSLDASKTEFVKVAPGTQVNYAAKDIAGYTFNEDKQENVTSATIAADGSTVLKLYYKITKFSVTYKNGDDVIGEAATVTADTKITLNKTAEKDGYVFAGWSANGKLYSTKSEYQVTDNVTFTAVFMELYTLNGAQLRIVGDVGIRFITYFDGAAIKDFADVSYAFGAKITSKSKDGTVSTKSIDAAGEENKLYSDGDKTCFNVVLKNVKEANYERTFYAQGYLTVTYSDGTTGTLQAVYKNADGTAATKEEAGRTYKGLIEAIYADVKDEADEDYFNEVTDLSGNVKYSKLDADDFGTIRTLYQTVNA